MEQPLPMLRASGVIWLTYFNSDDGVWLECDCGWSHNLGFKTTPNQAVVIANNHLTSDAHRS